MNKLPKKYEYYLNHVFCTSFKHRGAEVFFKFEIAGNFNVFEQRDESLDDCVPLHEQVADSILKTLFGPEEVLFNLDLDFQIFYSKEARSVKMLSEKEKLLIILNISDFEIRTKITYDDL